ncbi:MULTISPECIES: hypothetical protein [Pseudomonas]|uniref:hypothetical protein n=1 Tax=Pseudomonas TaxID=286 RepID=UPI001303FD40|nr:MULTISPECIES: hypothetical protein [unclassified Pseudomonas]
MRALKEIIRAVAMISALLAGYWFATDMGRTFAMVCVRIVGEQRGLEAALEECK